MRMTTHGWQSGATDAFAPPHFELATAASVWVLLLGSSLLLSQLRRRVSLITRGSLGLRTASPSSELALGN
jgi:hypothetical protein